MREKIFQLLKARVARIGHQHSQYNLIFCYAGNMNEKLTSFAWLSL